MFIIIIDGDGQVSSIYNLERVILNNPRIFREDSWQAINNEIVVGSVQNMLCFRMQAI